MTERPNPYPLRIDKSIMEKTKFLATDSGRSVNKEIEYQLKKAIADYESKHGAIPLPDLSQEE